MNIPKYDELYKEILLALQDGEPYDIEAIRDKVAKLKGVSDQDRTIMLESGSRSVFNDRIGWARTYLKSAGLVTYPKRGLTQITDEGRAVIAQNPHTIDNEFLQHYDSFREFKDRARQANKSTVNNIDFTQDDTTPSERIQSAFAEINSSLGDELLAEIMRQAPSFFERIVVKLLIKMGYGGSLGDSAGQVTQLSNDEGIDGVIREDKLGFSNIYIQAKRWDISKSVSRPAIQGFVGAIANKAGKGLFITTASFSDGARQCAKENHVVLIDGNRLASLMIEYGVGVSLTQTYEIKEIDSDFFSE
jgi:restriction system protein